MSYYATGNVTYNPYTINVGSAGTTGSLGMSGTVLASNGTSPLWASTGTYTIADNSSWNTNPVKITHKGMKMPDNAHIKFGNTSLRETLQAIESRLAILRPDPALESEWEELKTLGDAYRKLEQEIQEKMKTWEVLKRVDE